MQHELDEIEPGHALRLFYLFFQRQAFLPHAWDVTGGGAAARTFHAYALNEARLYEEKVSQDLGARVFSDIFPQLADALARGDLHARTHEVGYGSSSVRSTRPNTWTKCAKSRWYQHAACSRSKGETGQRARGGECAGAG